MRKAYGEFSQKLAEKTSPQVFLSLSYESPCSVSEVEVALKVRLCCSLFVAHLVEVPGMGLPVSTSTHQQ